MSERKPVTELYEAVQRYLRRGDAGGLHDMAGHLETEDGEPQRELLEVLDLVATSGALGFVRWVVGLTVEQLGEVQGLLEMGTAEAKKLGYPDWEKGVAYGAEFMRAALSGGEDGAKCLECHGAGKVKRVQGSGSIRVVKYDPCPKCAGGAKEEREFCEGDQIGHGRCPEEAEASCAKCGKRYCRDHLGQHGRHCVRILPAGKPPPFLRKEMKLETFNGVRTVASSPGRMAGYAKDAVLLALRGEIVGGALVEVALTWPLAEPFTVEGET